MRSAHPIFDANDEPSTFSYNRQNRNSAASLQERERNRYEKPINLRASGSIRRKEPKHSGNGVVCAFCPQRRRFDLAIRAAANAAADRWTNNIESASRFRIEKLLSDIGSLDNE